MCSGGAQLAEMYKPTVNAYTPRGFLEDTRKTTGSLLQTGACLHGLVAAGETLNLSNQPTVAISRSSFALGPLVFSGPPPSPGYRLAARYWIW